MGSIAFISFARDPPSTRSPAVDRGSMSSFPAPRRAYQTLNSLAPGLRQAACRNRERGNTGEW